MLERLKPVPLPDIHPVPEYLASGRLKELYEDTKAVLQVPWMGVVTMAFAHYPTFYETLWSGVRTLCASAPFVEAARSLRRTAEAEAATLEPHPIADRLADRGYAMRELDQIRETLEVFSHGNMPYLLIATMARLLLEGESLSDDAEASVFEGRHGPSQDNRLVLMEQHHAGSETRAVYTDVRHTLGLPFVNTDYRALARWPSYFATAWGELSPQIDTPAYRAATENVHRQAIDLAMSLPNPGALTPAQLQAAAAEDADPDTVLSVVRLFQWLLPGLVVNVGHFRAQLQKSA